MTGPTSAHEEMRFPLAARVSHRKGSPTTITTTVLCTRRVFMTLSLHADVFRARVSFVILLIVFVFIYVYCWHRFLACFSIFRVTVRRTRTVKYTSSRGVLTDLAF